MTKVKTEEYKPPIFKVVVDDKKIDAEIYYYKTTGGKKIDVTIKGEGVRFFDINENELLIFLAREKIIENHQEWSRTGIRYPGGGLFVLTFEKINPV